MATKVQSHPIDTSNFPRDGRPEKSECQATDMSSLWSRVVWRDVMQYLGDLLTRNVTVHEFLSGMSTGLFNEFQKARGRIEFQERSQDDEIIIFGHFNHNPVPQAAEEHKANVASSDSRLGCADTLFVQLHAAALSVADDEKRSRVIWNIDQLEKSRRTPGYLRAYEAFIASVADHMDAFGSFVPPLTKMLSEK